MRGHPPSAKRAERLAVLQAEGVKELSAAGIGQCFEHFVASAMTTSDEVHYAGKYPHINRQEGSAA
jgi:hypothetical protein